MASYCFNINARQKAHMKWPPTVVKLAQIKIAHIELLPSVGKLAHTKKRKGNGPLQF